VQAAGGTTVAGHPGRTAGARRGPTSTSWVVGPAFSGLYLLHRLRRLGFSARAYDTAGDVGGTGTGTATRVHAATSHHDYAFSFDPELEAE